MKRCLFASLILLTFGADANAELYKYTGPDGKVVYADRPPAAPTPHVQVFSAGVPRAVTASERGFVAPRKAEQGDDVPAQQPEKQQADRQAESAAALAAAAQDPKARELAPLLPALRAAMGEATLVERTVDLCISTLPTAYKRYVGAQDAWKTRNAAVTARVGTIVADVSGEDRLRLEQQALDHTAERLRGVRAVGRTERIAWCDRTAGEIGAGKFDLAGLPGVQALLRPAGR